MYSSKPKDVLPSPLEPTPTTPTTEKILADIDDQSSLVVYSDLIALVLEIINAALSKNLADNPNLVYALLHQQDLFAQFRTYIKFQALIENLDTVTAHFQSRIHDEGLDGAGYVDILGLIEREGKVWESSKLKDVTVISFKYEEEKNAEEFFHPLVWAMIALHPSVSWNVASHGLFIEFVGSGAKQ